MEVSALAIFAALEDEIRITRSKMQVDESVSVKPARIVKGQYMNVPLIVVRTGVGMEAMADAVSFCINQYKPAQCLNVGFCGAASPELAVGDLVIADRIIDSLSDMELTPDTKLIQDVRDKCESRNLRYAMGGMVTVNEPICGPHEKAFVGTKHEAKAVEMESFAFARRCDESKVPYAVIRAVLDPMEMVLPDFESAINEEGETSVLGAIKHVIKKPCDIFSIPRIEYCAVQAREAIARFIDAWLGVKE